MKANESWSALDRTEEEHHLQSSSTVSNVILESGEVDVWRVKHPQVIGSTHRLGCWMRIWVQPVISVWNLRRNLDFESLSQQWEVEKSTYLYKFSVNSIQDKSFHSESQKTHSGFRKRNQGFRKQPIHSQWHWYLQAKETCLHEIV